MRKIHKRIIPLLVSITLLLSICFNVFVGVSANGSNHRAIFTYGDFAGVAVAVGADPDDIIISENKITLPDNEQIMNLYWKNGSKNYRAGSVVSVEELSADNDGNYYFTALFGSVSLDFENINTSNVTLPTSAGNKSKNLYEELSRASSYWRVPQGISNTTADGSGYYALALGNTKMGIVANVGKSGKGLQLSIDKNYSIPEYRNAVLFSHNPTSFDASSNIQYSYVYFTPNTEYMMEFDYKTTSSVDVAVAFGVSTTTGNANCGTKSINSSSFNTTDNHITLESTGGEWQHAFITVTSPSSYTGNSVTSARIGIAVKDNEKTNASTTRKSYLDNIKIQTGGTKVDFVYGNADLGEYTVSFADDEGNITLPEYDSVLPGNDNVANLLWKHGNNLYTPGTNLNISQLDNDLKFVAYFGGYSLDFENINTSNVTLPTSAGNKNMNLFGELSRSASYYRVPQGISNTTASGGYYGLALGNTTMGIANAGKSGKGLQLSIAANYSTPEYRNAVLFSHNPTSFDASSNIQYSYVYFTPNTEYTLEFDYKTTSSVDVAVAFGVSTTSGNANCGTKSINSASFDMTGNHISLDSTNGEWQHGSITVTSPSSYTGNSVTSARVGIAVKDNETTDASTTRKSSFDNINFYPSTMMCNSVKIQYGSETDDNDSRTISYFKFKSPLKSNNTIVLPENGTVTACFRSGVNESGAYWSSNYGKITNLIGWKLLNSDNIYGVQDSVAVDTLPQNAVFSAIYGDETVDFQSVDESFVINNSGKMSYGSKKAKIVEEDGNKFVRLEQETDDVKKEYNHVMMFTGNNKFAGYNVNQMYKITLKYRRLDNTKQESRMYFAFGGITYDWRARENSISKSEVCVTKTGMTDFETISFVVTSPANQTNRRRCFFRLVKSCCLLPCKH